MPERVAMADPDMLELRFRLCDGMDIGPSMYPAATSIGSLKEIILGKWPQGKENTPKNISDIKLINAGRILENNKTISESRVPFGEIPGGVITMHVVVHLQSSNKKEEKQITHLPKKNRCLCRIL